MKFLGGMVFALACFCVSAKKASRAAASEMVAPVTISSNERILKGALVAPDRSHMESFVVLFRGEKRETDSSGFYTFSKKADRETFESAPFKQKMTQSLQGKSAVLSSGVLSAPDYSGSPLLSTPVHDDKFYILITKDIEPVLEGTNDISGFRQVAGAPHLFFSTIVQNSERADEDVLIKPRSIEKRNYLFAPDRTIVILMNPNRVAKIEYWPFKLDSQFIQLPRIILQTEEEIAGRKGEKKAMPLEEGAGEDELEAQTSEKSLLPKVARSRKANLARQSVKSQMYGLDMAPFFETPDTVEVSKRIARNQLVEIRM